MFVPVVPNWSTPPRAVYAFQTTVMEVENETEYRAAARTTPRRAIEFDTFPEAQRIVRDYALRSISTTPFRIADPTQPAAQLAENLGPAGTVVELTEHPAWLVAGARVAIVWKRHAVEAVVARVLTERPVGGFPYLLPFDFDREPQIAGFPYELPFQFNQLADGDSAGVFLVLSSPSGRIWPAGAMVQPVVEGWFDNARFDALTAGVMTGSVRFSVLPGGEAADEGFAEPGLHSREAMTFKPDWSGPVSFEYPTTVDTVDFGRGRIASYAPVLFKGRTISATFRGHEDFARNFVRFFSRMKGRRGEFYRPTWTDDLTVAEDLPPGGTSLRVAVAGSATAAQYGDRRTYPAVAIYYRDGSVKLAYVNHMEPTAGQTWLTVDGTAFPAGLRRADVALVSWVSLCRFASDELTVVWQTRNQAEIQCSVLELKEIAPDAGGQLLSDGALWLLAMYGNPFLFTGICDPIQKVVNVDYPRATLPLA